MKMTAILPTLITTGLMATSYTAPSGWSLFGTNSEVSVSKILENKEIRNIVIYRNGNYKYSANNDFTTIPANSGFWLFASNATTVTLEDSVVTKELLVNLKRFDSSLNEVKVGTSWDILELQDENLYMEMKTSTYSIALRYTQSEAVEYCNALQIGSLSEWRLPTRNEANRINNVSSVNFEYFLLKESSSYWTSTVDESDDDRYYTINYFSDSSYSSSYSSSQRAVCVHNK